MTDGRSPTLSSVLPIRSIPNKPGDILINHPTLHHKRHLPTRSDIRYRIPIHRDNIRVVTHRNGPNLLPQPERLRSNRSSAHQSIHRRLPAIFDSINQLLAVMPIRPRGSISPINNPEPRCPQSSLKHV